jgi:hypothetical protein
MRVFSRATRNVPCSDRQRTPQAYGLPNRSPDKQANRITPGKSACPLVLVGSRAEPSGSGQEGEKT